MTYPGNPSLAPDVRNRILETWEHTRSVAAEGKTEEAKLGCDFILRLDPLFAPAQRLSDRLDASDGPVDVSDLGADVSAASPEAPAAEAELEMEPPESLEPLESLEELPELSLEDAVEPEELEEPAAAEPAVFATDLRAELAELVATRDFATLMVRAEEEKEAIGADPELQRLLGEAQEKMEAAPYVESFLEQAESAYERGDEEEARAALEKARALDDGHPRLQALDAALGAAAPAAPAAEAPEPVEPMPTAEPADEIEAFDMEELPELPELEAESPAVAEPELPEEADSDDSLSLDDFEAPGEDLSLDGLEDLPSLGEAAEAEEVGASAEAAAPAASGGPSDPDPRIAELLDEGQAAFEREEYQAAIDAWSRIFLIDIDHQEAARRIEKAREQKSEEERRVEEAYHEALAHAEAGEMDEAKSHLERVLELSPNHLAASQMLEKIEKGELTPEDLTGDKADEEIDLEAALAPEPEDDEAPALPAAEIMVPPEPGKAPRRPAPVEPPPQPAKAGGSRRTLILAAAALVVLLGAVGGFLWFRGGSLFPNTEESAASPPAPETSPIERATELFDQGRSGVAIAQLKRIPPASPYYEEAQALLSRWETSQPTEGPPPAEAARRRALLEEADASFAEERYLDAIAHYEEAARIAPLESEAADRLVKAREVVRPLEPLINLVRAGEYDRALRDLWLRREESPDDPVVRRLLADSYYNLGVRSLQQGRPEEAKGHFGEVLTVSPDDDAARRLQQLAETYDGRSQDLLYKIYVKYLAPRSV